MQGEYSIRTRAGNFFKHWPTVGVFAALLTICGIVLFAFATAELLAGRDPQLARLLAISCGLAAGYAWGWTLAVDSRSSESDLRSFPASSAFWLLRPLNDNGWSASAGIRSVGFAIFYFAFRLLVAAYRAVGLAFYHPSLRGDLVSMRATDGQGGYWIAAIEDITDTRVGLRVLRRTKRRAYGIRISAAERHACKSSIIPRDVFDDARALLVWRGKSHQRYAAIIEASSRIT